ncbi:MAG: carbohydrate binding family 9 domain-containing protein [Armatimonadetes bacterium]|nr:carbohydrate binding family 9 domain-containing protein [Armatimonadota bacterium]
MKPDQRRRRHGIALIFLVCLAPGAAARAEVPAAPPALMLGGPVVTPPRIDGRLDDDCWRAAAQSTGFSLLAGVGPATEQTTIYVTYNSQHLYIAFECLESRMDRLEARTTERDGPVLKDDSVQVFLDPNQDRFTYYQFAVNARGTRLDLKGDAAGAQAGWDTPWNAAAARGEDRWWAEMAIPFSSLDIHLGKTTGTWGINFAREERPKRESSVWSFTGGSPAQPARFGLLTGLEVDFSRFAYGIEVVDLGGRLAGNNVLTARVSAPFAGRLLARLEVYLPDGEAQKREVAVDVAPGRPARVSLPYALPREGLYRMVLRVRDPASGETLRAAGVSVAIPPLLELALYPNHYRREVWVRPRLNVRESDLKEFRITARLLKDGALVPPEREMPVVVVKEPTIQFSLAESGPGDYEAVVVVAPRRSGAGLVRETARFRLAAAPPPDAPAVSIDPDNVLVVRGNRFFPLGLYRYGRGTPSDKALSEIRLAGFNLLQVPPGHDASETRALLDRARAYGLQAWVPLGEAAAVGSGDTAAEERLRELVRPLAAHPALLCWESLDEPAWVGRKAADLERGYHLLRALDPAHPVWTNHAPRNAVDELALFNRATDIAGADVYPVPEPQTQSDLPEKTIAVVGEETSKNVLAVLNRKPVFMALQAFAWADLARQQGGTGTAIYPTRAQSRFMAYHAIVRGARGLLWWGAQHTPKPSPFWNDLCSVVHELSQVQDVLAGPNTGDIVAVLAGGKAIECLVRRPNESTDRFIIAVNASPQAVNARLQVPRAMPKVPWRVLFERRTLVGNPIVDRFEPWDVHIYTASTTFPEERFLNLPPVGAMPRPRPEDLTQAGNLLVNPGFEYTEEGDEVPVGWDVRPALGGAAVTDERRTGRYCVMLRGRTPEAMPLWAQSGIATEQGRRYRLSAHVRTRPADARYRLYAEWTDAEGKLLGGHVPLDWSRGARAWREEQLDFTVDHPDARKMYVVLQLKGEGQAWFDDVRLEEAR